LKLLLGKTMAEITKRILKSRVSMLWELPTPKTLSYI
jgi:hypothetical protein